MLTFCVTQTGCQILSSGRDWTVNLDLAKSVISSRGGPAVLLARSSRPSPGTITGVSRARLFLEFIAVYDIFGKATSKFVPFPRNNVSLP